MTSTATTETAATYAVFAKAGWTGYALVVRDADPDTCAAEPWNVAAALPVSLVLFADVMDADTLAGYIEPGSGLDVAEFVAFSAVIDPAERQ